MDTTNVLFVGLKDHVVAFAKDNGQELWRTKLKSGTLATSGFVTLLTDGKVVFACTGGALFCLDAQSGSQLWSNDLPGLGYGIASLAIVGASAPPVGAIEERQRQESSASGAAAASCA